ncbi:hypothetical protein FQN57_003404 [Myotisia sp. PD_48]|nr:hypothetical protein FQN57_003404 [Myotisia sp. PD_48]
MTSHKSSILFQNTELDIFIIDIPTSISLAQHDPIQLASNQTVPFIYSSPPKQYGTTSSEPKSSAARAKVLARVPIKEQVNYHSIIETVKEAEAVLLSYDGERCWPRHSPPTSNTTATKVQVENRSDTLADKHPFKKKRLGDTPIIQDEPTLSVGGDYFSALYLRESPAPPVILSPGVNRFHCLKDIQGSIVKNTSPLPAELKLRVRHNGNEELRGVSLMIPPLATFILSHLAPSTEGILEMNFTSRLSSLIPKFDFILADPPWPNRSVKRSLHYRTPSSFLEIEFLVTDVIRGLLKRDGGIVAIWTTNSANSREVVYNSFHEANVRLVEEWIWVKTKVGGGYVMPLDGVWRKPYEVLMIGRGLGESREDTDFICNNLHTKRRVMEAVPDIHSRKPNLKELVEKIFFSSSSQSPSYSALEVFARNLTAGWWAIGDEALRFNWDGWWAKTEQPKDTDITTPNCVDH